MLTLIERVIFLQNVDIFSIVPTEQLSYLAAIGEEQSVSTGEDIYKEQDAADSLYLVLDGQVKLHSNKVEITVANKKEAFGTWALFDEQVRVATATAIVNTKLLRIDRDEFYEILTDHVQIVEGIFKALTKKLRGLLKNVGIDTNRKEFSKK